MSIADDKQSLAEFVKDLERLLYLVVEMARSMGLLLDEENDKLLREAWKEVRPRFDEIVRYIQGEALLPKSSGELEGQLNDCGLVGAQLKLKLRIYYQRRGEFDRAVETLRTSPQPGFLRRSFKALGRVLRPANRILESMGFVPGVHAVKEMKGIVEELTP